MQSKRHAMCPPVYYQVANGLMATFPLVIMSTCAHTQSFIMCPSA